MLNNKKKFLYPSFGKINLFLHILNKRHDGYHNLQTWFQFIDLRDYLYFTIRKDNKISIISNIKELSNKNNIIFNVLNSMKKYSSQPKGLDIYIKKNIPIGAGLGGGSSNAATTLIAINNLWKCNLNNEMLHKIGYKISADIPIFLFQKAAWAEGIGEILIEKHYIEQYILLIKPRFRISTKFFFSKMFDCYFKEKIDHIEINFSKLTNSFLPLILKYYPQFYEELKKLPNYDKLKLSGTGSCFYLLSSNVEFLKKNQCFLKKNIDSCIVKTLNSAPVNSL